MSALTTLALGLALGIAPADAYHGARATVSIDNDIHVPVGVYVDGVFQARIAPGRRFDLAVAPGTHGIRLIQGRGHCVLSADIVDLPRGARVYYDIDRTCRPAHWSDRWSWTADARWNNTWVRWRPGRDFVVVHDPSRFQVRRHHGAVRAPYVHRGDTYQWVGPRWDGRRGDRWRDGHHGHHGRDRYARRWDDDDSSDRYRQRHRWDDDDSSSDRDRYRHRWGDDDSSSDRDRRRDRWDDDDSSDRGRDGRGRGSGGGRGPR